MFGHADFEDSQEAQCLTYFERSLGKRGASEALAKALAPAMMAEHTVMYTSGGGDPNVMHMVLPTIGWAIRDCDFEFVEKLLEAPLVTGGTALAGAVAAGPSGSLIGAAIGLGLQSFRALYKMHLSARRNGASVGIRKTALLCSLKQLNNGTGATAKEITEYVAQQFPRTPYTLEEVGVDLEELRTVTTNTGSEVAFAFTVDTDKKVWKTSC